jgi:acetolactate synthase-1/2/3 large subunit
MVGFDPVEFDRDWSARARIVHIGLVPNDDRYYGSEVEIVGPIDAALERLCAASQATPKVARDEISAFRDAFLSRVRGSGKGLTAQEVLRELRAALPEDALVTCDVGYNKAVSAQCWPAYRPRTFFVSNGLSSMGYGLPAALALKLADRARPVACVLGDGGFAMAMAEIETGTRLGLEVTVIVLVDDALSQIKAGQERKGYPITGTTFGQIDYAKLGEAFGIDAMIVSTVDECRAAFKKTPRARPMIVAARIDPAGYRVD